jgi:hypothetical protein
MDMGKPNVRLAAEGGYPFEGAAGRRRDRL